MKRFLLATLLIASALMIARAAFHQETTTENPPTVIRAVAPDTYPTIARQAHADARVVVEVKIDAIGKVVSAKMVEGHPLLQNPAVTAAKQWLFVSGAGGREARLTFTFLSGSGERDKVSFIPPYQVEFVSREIHIDTSASPTR